MPRLWSGGLSGGRPRKSARSTPRRFSSGVGRSASLDDGALAAAPPPSDRTSRPAACCVIGEYWLPCSSRLEGSWSDLSACAIEDDVDPCAADRIEGLFRRAGLREVDRDVCLRRSPRARAALLKFVPRAAAMAFEHRRCGRAERARRRCCCLVVVISTISAGRTFSVLQPADRHVAVVQRCQGAECRSRSSTAGRRRAP